MIGKEQMFRALEQVNLDFSVSKVHPAFEAVFFPLRAHALILLLIGFTLTSVQTHISKQFRIEMCVCTILKTNPIGERVRAYALKGKINFTSIEVLGRGMCGGDVSLLNCDWVDIFRPCLVSHPKNFHPSH